MVNPVGKVGVDLIDAMQNPVKMKESTSLYIITDNDSGTLLEVDLLQPPGYTKTILRQNPSTILYFRQHFTVLCKTLIGRPMFLPRDAL